MIQKVMRDIAFLKIPSESATAADAQVADDLLDTLKANAGKCVGMAANMIGVSKRIIAVNMGAMNVAMVNPVILKKSGPYQAEEGCLSLTGVRKTTRYQDIEVSFLKADFVPMQVTYSGWVAQIIQHEIDHLNGVLI